MYLLQLNRSLWLDVSPWESWVISFLIWYMKELCWMSHIWHQPSCSCYWSRASKSLLKLGYICTSKSNYSPQSLYQNKPSRFYRAGWRYMTLKLACRNSTCYFSCQNLLHVHNSLSKHFQLLHTVQPVFCHLKHFKVKYDKRVSCFYILYSFSHWHSSLLKQFSEN